MQRVRLNFVETGILGCARRACTGGCRPLRHAVERYVWTGNALEIQASEIATLYPVQNICVERRSARPSSRRANREIPCRIDRDPAADGEMVLLHIEAALDVSDLRAPW